MIRIPILIPVASDFDSDSSVVQEFSFRFWFQHYVILIPVFRKFNDSDSKPDSSNIDLDSYPNLSDIEYDFNSEPMVYIMCTWFWQKYLVMLMIKFLTPSV